MILFLIPSLSSSLLTVSKTFPASNDTLRQLRLKWMEITEMALIVHTSFNRITNAILNYDDGVEELIFASEGEVYPLWDKTLHGETRSGNFHFKII